MYSMPGSWIERQIQRMSGSAAEHPLATKRRHVAWENPLVRVEYNLVHNVATREEQLSVRITPAADAYYAAIIVPLATDGRLHLVGRYRYPIGRWSVEFPRFDFDNGEAGWKAGAAADLLRTTGLRSARMTLLGAVQNDPALLSTSTVVILAEGCATGLAGPPHTSPPHASAAAEELIAGSLALSLAELSDLIHRGEIACGVTLAALALYRARR